MRNNPVQWSFGRSVTAFAFAALLAVAPAWAQQPTPAAGAPGAGAAGARAAAPRPQMPTGPRIKALVVAGGCCHDYPMQTAILMKEVQKVLPVDWTFEYIGGTNGAHVPTFYDNPKWYEGYDMVVHNECFTPGDSLISQQYLKNILAATQAGIPAMVIHCAMHTFRAEPTDEWRHVQGVKSVRHGPATRAPVKVAMPSHPIMQGIPAEWLSPVDEIYVLDVVYPGTQALATAVEPSNNTEYPVMWVHEAQGARVFGTSIGHSQPTWDDPVYRQILVQGFKWAVKR
jgi:uncharacterized protein